MKTTLDTPLSAQELEALDAFLLDAGLDAPMDISMLDGFLCALLSGPRMIMPSEWMPWVWDHEAAEQAPEFANPKDATRVAEMMLRFCNEIADGLMSAPEEFEPLFPESTADTGSVPIIDDWCYGFLKGVALDAGGWQPLLDAHPEWFATIRLYGTEEGWKALEEEIEPLPDADQRHLACVDSIAPALRDIHAYSLALRMPGAVAPNVRQQPLRSAPRQGRNEPCACGSGRKYKLCHGAAV